MADEPVLGRSEQAPDFLTVDQTSDVLQLGRSTTYELVGLYVETEGAGGIPAVMCGGQYRIPRARLEAWHGGPISWPPAKRKRAGRSKRAPQDVQECSVEASAVEPSGCDESIDGEVGGPMGGPRSKPHLNPADDAVERGAGTADLDLAGRGLPGSTATSRHHPTCDPSPVDEQGSVQLHQLSLLFEG